MLLCSLTLRVHVPTDWVLGFWVIVSIIQVSGGYMIIRYLDAWDRLSKRCMIWWPKLSIGVSQPNVKRVARSSKDLEGLKASGAVGISSAV